MKCLKFPENACDLLTCQTKGKCLWHDDFATNPKEPEAVHGNEAEKEVCNHVYVVDGSVSTTQMKCCKCGSMKLLSFA